ncbi:MAG: transporter substrate-binding domain-containing protein [Coriobacteriales bacterium]|jgi:polar amino acid transport system substrate-binding protein|nr:transporter substrate-binding domain-containing protein [Coriobacteriales bacterium]
MKLWRMTRAAALVAVLLAASLALGGCAGATGSKQQALTPTVDVPAVHAAGVLKVGVDSAHAPYAGTSKGKIVGIDVDVASALAEQLGLKVEIVDMVGKSPDDLLADGSVDVVMDVEQSGSNVTQGKTVGPYLLSGPALFAKTRSNEVPELDIQTLSGTKISAQKDSLSAWTVDELIGKGTASSVATLADALKAVNDGASTYAAADAIVGSYLAIEYQDISCVKILGTPIGVYCAVAADNGTLADALTGALRELRDNGELVVIISKWLGPVSAQVVISSQAVVAQNTDANAAAGTGSGAGSEAGAASAAPAGDPGQIDTGEDLPDPSNAGGTG